MRRVASLLITAVVGVGMGTVLLSALSAADSAPSNYYVYRCPVGDQGQGNGNNPSSECCPVRDHGQGKGNNDGQGYGNNPSSECCPVGHHGQGNGNNPSRECTGRSFGATLSGLIGHRPGDPNGSGQASLTIVPGANQLCYTLSVSGIARPTAAQVRRGSIGYRGQTHYSSKNAAVAVLDRPPVGSSNGCVVVTQQKLAAITSNPSQYYVVIMNNPFRQGALRGYLQSGG
jgi:hypothetical protein